MNVIPEEFQISTLLNQDTYLIDGELKNGPEGQLQFFQRFHLQKNTTQRY
jgi:hypothetical protein